MSKQHQEQPKIFCKCCLKLLTPDDSRIPVTDKTRDIFFKYIRFPMKDGLICGKCNINLLTFDAFQREVRRKHSLVAIVEKGSEGSLLKKIKQEDPLDISNAQRPQINHKSHPVPLKIPTNPISHKSVPVNPNKYNWKCKERYDANDLKKLRESQMLAASIKAQVG